MTETTIPTTVVPIRYAATYADSSTPIDFGTDRAALLIWIAERARVAAGANLNYGTPKGRGALAADRRAYAETVVQLAEGRGTAYAFAWDVPASIEAWQRPVTQGEADDLAAWEAAQAAASAYVVTTAPEGDDRTDGLRRMPLDEATRTALTDEGVRRGARILPVSDDDRRAAYLARHPEHAANFPVPADGLILDMDAPTDEPRSYDVRTQGTGGVRQFGRIDRGAVLSILARHGVPNAGAELLLIEADSTGQAETTGTDGTLVWIDTEADEDTDGDTLTVNGEPIRTGERAVHRSGSIQISRKRSVVPPLSGAYLPEPVVGRVAVLIPSYTDSEQHPDWKIGAGRFRIQVDGALWSAMQRRSSADRLVVLVADGHGLHPYCIQGWSTGPAMAVLAPLDSADLPGDYVVLSISGLFTGPAV